MLDVFFAEENGLKEMLWDTSVRNQDAWELGYNQKKAFWSKPISVILCSVF